MVLGEENKMKFFVTFLWMYAYVLAIAAALSVPFWLTAGVSWLRDNGYIGDLAAAALLIVLWLGVLSMVLALGQGDWRGPD